MGTELLVRYLLTFFKRPEWSVLKMKMKNYCCFYWLFHNFLFNSSMDDLNSNSFFPGYIPNNALAIEAMLATSSIGAVWSSTSPDFGVSVCWYY